MKLFLKVLAFVCLSVPLWGQGYRYDSNAFTSANNVPAGSQSTMFTVPFAKITVCAYPDNGSQPCTNTVPIYQDPALTVAATNPITADVHGRFGFWKSAGTYTFSMVSPGGEFLGTFVISLGGGGQTTLALTTTGSSGPSTLTHIWVHAECPELCWRKRRLFAICPGKRSSLQPIRDGLLRIGAVHH